MDPRAAPPIGRALAPEEARRSREIGDLIVYLGFGATMVTGQTVICDAGLTL